MDTLVKKIPIDELSVGMCTVNPNIDWKKNPFVYDKEQQVRSTEEVQAIKDAGYTEVYIDLGCSNSEPFQKELNDIAVDWTRNIPRPAPLEEELPKAARIVADSVRYAKKFMHEAESGKVDIDSATPVVEDIIQSVSRNIDALTSIINLRQSDEYTYTHCVNVCILSTCFSRFMQQPDEKAFTMGLAGLFHDIGKALVPQTILNAPRQLSREEFSIMQSHPVLGYQHLMQVKDIMPDILYGAAQHHEKFDGSGYPQGLKGDQISLTGRIVGLADVYDALTSRRVYKISMPPHKAMAIMYQMRDKHFSTADLSSFIRMMGVYPVGSIVKLEENSTAVVSQSNQEKPTQPKVILVMDSRGVFIEPEEKDIAKGEASPIIGSIQQSMINPLRVLARQRIAV